MLTVVNTTATAGNYVGNGDPDDSATCPEPSGDTSAGGKQGTLCTFFKYVAGGLQAANKFVSLSPEYKTKFVPVYEGPVDIHGCHQVLSESIQMVAREGVGPPSST